MKKAVVVAILKKWTNGLSGEKALIRIFEKVRDIPYGTIGSRDPEQVYLKRRGTCSGKNFLFYELASGLGFKTKHFVCSHKFRQLKVKFPVQLREMLKEDDFLDYHNFVKVFVNNKWLTVDVTWDLPLKKYGFPVQENWDGKSDTTFGVTPIKIYEVANPETFKEEKIALMPKNEQEIRKVFIQRLSDWVSTLR